MPKLSYFDQDKPDADDYQLAMAIRQGYVPRGCLLAGFIVMSEVEDGRHPCWGCNCPREKCGSRFQKVEE